LSSECDGRAHDSAKVEDRVRFLERTWPWEGGSKHYGAFFRDRFDQLENLLETMD
jgi:hypothetical protein